MNPCTPTPKRPILLLVVLLSMMASACSSSSPVDRKAGTSGQLKESPLLGKWNLSKKTRLENGHDLVQSSDYEFVSNGTFSNDSRTKLIDGTTGDPLCIQRSAESGIWTADQSETSWTTEKAELVEFETFTNLITRDAIEQSMAADRPPERFSIISSGDTSIKLTLIPDGPAITLTRKE